MADSKLVDLKRTKVEKKDRADAIKTIPYSGEDYSYGTRLTLGESELDKLGHDENPSVGTEHHFFVKGRVTHSSHDQDEQDEPRRSVTVQLTHMTPLKASKDKSVREGIEDALVKGQKDPKGASGKRELKDNE